MAQTITDLNAALDALNSDSLQLVARVGNVQAGVQSLINQGSGFDTTAQCAKVAQIQGRVTSALATLIAVSNQLPSQ